MLLSTVSLFQAQVCVAEVSLTSRKVIWSQICVKIVQGKGNRALLGLES